MRRRHPGTKRSALNGRMWAWCQYPHGLSAPEHVLQHVRYARRPCPSSDRSRVALLYLPCLRPLRAQATTLVILMMWSMVLYTISESCLDRGLHIGGANVYRLGAPEVRTYTRTLVRTFLCGNSSRRCPLKCKSIAERGVLLHILVHVV